MENEISKIIPQGYPLLSVTADPGEGEIQVNMIVAWQVDQDILTPVTIYPHGSFAALGDTAGPELFAEICAPEDRAAACSRARAWLKKKA